MKGFSSLGGLMGSQNKGQAQQKDQKQAGFGGFGLGGFGIGGKKEPENKPAKQAIPSTKPISNGSIPVKKELNGSIPAKTDKKPLPKEKSESTKETKSENIEEPKQSRTNGMSASEKWEWSYGVVEKVMRIVEDQNTDASILVNFLEFSQS